MNETPGRPVFFDKNARITRTAKQAQSLQKHLDFAPRRGGLGLNQGKEARFSAVSLVRVLVLSEFSCAKRDLACGVKVGCPLSNSPWAKKTPGMKLENMAWS